MGRKIKFREFDVISKQMWQWGEIFDIPACEIFPGTPEQRPWAVMQYTGLKDKNGIEIYEADIVRLRNSAGFHCLATVEFNDGCFDLKFQMPLYENGVRKPRDYVKVFVANHAIEVIGNIYENPDLLANTVSE